MGCVGGPAGGGWLSAWPRQCLAVGRSTNASTALPHNRATTGAAN